MNNDLYIKKNINDIFDYHNGILIFNESGDKLHHIEKIENHIDNKNNSLNDFLKKIYNKF